jgi:hypothetical protein
MKVSALKIIVLQKKYQSLGNIYYSLKKNQILGSIYYYLK